MAFLEGIKAPFYEKSSSAFFDFLWFPQKIQKGRWIFIELSENYHMWISRDFWGAEASRIPAFLFWKRALAVSPRFQAVLLFQGGRLFYVLIGYSQGPDKLLFSAPNKCCHCEERSDVVIPLSLRNVRKTDKRPNEPPGIVVGLPRPVCALVSQWKF